MTYIGATIAMSMLAATPHSLSPQERAALLDAARVPVVAALGKPILFKVRHVAAGDGWAFLFADMQDRAGTAVDLAGTPLADAAAGGAASRACAVLLRREKDAWRVVESRVGVTDAVWEDWAKRYPVPAGLFRF